VDTSDGRDVQIPSGTPVAATEHPPQGQDMPPWVAQPLSEIAQLGTDVARVQTTLAGRPHHRFWKGEREREREID
jgi:hypothetical protein